LDAGCSWDVTGPGRQLAGHVLSPLARAVSFSFLRSFGLRRFAFGAVGRNIDLIPWRTRTARAAITTTSSAGYIPGTRFAGESTAGSFPPGSPWRNREHMPARFLLRSRWAPPSATALADGSFLGSHVLGPAPELLLPALHLKLRGGRLPAFP